MSTNLERRIGTLAYAIRVAENDFTDASMGRFEDARRIARLIVTTTEITRRDLKEELLAILGSEFDNSIDCVLLSLKELS